MHKNLLEQEQQTSTTKQQAAKRSTLVSVVINIVLASIQIFVGIFSKSNEPVANPPTKLI